MFTDVETYQITRFKMCSSCQLHLSKAFKTQNIIELFGTYFPQLSLALVGILATTPVNGGTSVGFCHQPLGL